MHDFRINFLRRVPCELIFIHNLRDRKIMFSAQRQELRHGTEWETRLFPGLLRELIRMRRWGQSGLARCGWHSTFTTFAISIVSSNRFIIHILHRILRMVFRGWRSRQHFARGSRTRPIGYGHLSIDHEATANTVEFIGGKQVAFIIEYTEPHTV